MRDQKPLRRLENFDPDRSCFACGQDNPNGLHMRFDTDGQRLYSRLTISKDLCGWEKVVHGGIVTAVLDEIMSWSAIHLIQRLILTKSIKVDFLKPVHVDSEIRAEGWVEKKITDREAVMASFLYNAGGSICAKGKGTFALLTPRAARKLGVIEEKVIRGFERYFGND